MAAQAVSVVAPSPGMMSATAMVTAMGAAAVPVIGLATLAMMLVGLAVAQFARRMAAAGSLYTYVSKGLGPTAGFLTGCALILAYGSLVVMCLLGSGRRVVGFLVEAGALHRPAGDAPALLVTALLGAAMTAIVVRGIRISAALTLLLEAGSVVAVLTALTVAAYRGTAAGPPPSALDLGVFAAALLTGIKALVGFESGCALSVEARKPFAVVPRVVLWTPAACGALFALAAVLHLVALARGGGADGSGPPLPVLPALVQLGLASSLFACAMASMNAVVRVLFSMGRERVTPPALGRTHARYRTPYVAAYAMVPLAVGVPLVMWALGTSTRRVSGWLGLLAVLAFLVAYLLVCLAAAPFLHRIGEATAGATGVAALAAAVTAGSLVLVVRAGLNDGLGWVVAALVGFLGLGLLWLLRVRRRAPHRLSAMGFFDAATPDDILPGASPDGLAPGAASRRAR
ncbi:APC family permease [Phytohabitans sp. ZYX-F-186]|uniref:APC family permease n=1 Tax=Phytohabitans maris TaxID=3071409 RepID=A0ABU0ZD95_9ACTN|nr:APC family permease [Phytohabitans sp. ZYX-F-186]MDQ7904404.1 APC family permease [Phytohabitans sp. ZYX-F-186]